MFIKFILSLLLCMSAVYSQYGWDDDNFRIPGSVLPGYAIINQLADDEGLEIYGFDDMSSVYIKLFIDGAGLSTAEASDAWLITAANNVTIKSEDENVYVKLGDAAGAKAFIVEDSGGDDMAFINSDGEGYFAGDVGIGTSPASRLTIRSETPWSAADNDYTTDNILIYNSGEGAGALNKRYGSITFRSANAFRGASIVGVQTGTDRDQLGLAFYAHPSTATGTALTEQMRMTHDGNVGINATAPRGRLDVRSSTAFSLVSNTYYTDTIYLFDGSVGDGIDNYGPSISFSGPGRGFRLAAIASVQTTADKDQVGLAFFTQPAGDIGAGGLTEMMRFTHNGRVGIKETNPGSTLDINGSIDFNSVAAGAETAIEAVVDLQDLQGAVIDAQVPNDITLSSINAATESAIEAVVDLQNLQGAVTDGQVPDNITTTGSTGTYTFGGGSSGDIASMTFAGGRLTSVTTVP